MAKGEISRQQVQETCGWPVRYADTVGETPPPGDDELTVLRELKARTDAAHSGNATQTRRGSRDG